MRTFIDCLSTASVSINEMVYFQSTSHLKTSAWIEEHNITPLSIFWQGNWLKVHYSYYSFTDALQLPNQPSE